MLLVTSVQLGLVVLAGLPVVLVATRLLARPLVGRAQAEQATLATATSVAADLVRGLRVLAGIGAQAAAAARYRTASAATAAELIARHDQELTPASERVRATALCSGHPSRTWATTITPAHPRAATHPFRWFG